MLPVSVSNIYPIGNATSVTPPDPPPTRSGAPDPSIWAVPTIVSDTPLDSAVAIYQSELSASQLAASQLSTSQHSTSQLSASAAAAVPAPTRSYPNMPRSQLQTNIKPQQHRHEHSKSCSSRVGPMGTSKQYRSTHGQSTRTPSAKQPTSTLVKPKGSRPPLPPAPLSVSRLPSEHSRTVRTADARTEGCQYFPAASAVRVRPRGGNAERRLHPRRSVGSMDHGTSSPHRLNVNSELFLVCLRS